MLPKEDIIRLRHMLEAAEQAVLFVQGKDRSDLDTDRMLSFAIVRAIEIMGEAAGKVSHESRENLSNLPWHSIIAMRNRLIHAYFDTDLDRVWETVTDDLPPLINSLRIALNSQN
ncbi:MAG: HepT-like ribonuclease domain-containing protein [Armatimonadota bacterium]